MNYFPEFAERVHEALLRLDRSPSWLAQRLGVHPGTVSRWLNQGARPGDVEMAVRVADVLGLAAQVQELLAAAGYGYVEVYSAHAAPVNEPSAVPAIDPLSDTPSHPRHNLPAQFTPIFGRDEELAAVGDLLGAAETRLVSIVGPGGVGKTRLAQEVGLRLLEGFRDGVFFVPLAPLRHGEDIVTAVAEALDLTFMPGERSPLRQTLDYLRRKRLLLVLDNCEHLPDSSEFAHSVLEAGPEVKVLATSRQRLKLSSEVVYNLRGIRYGDGQDEFESDAMRLFLHRARMTRAEYEPTKEELPHVVRLCRLLHGMPLAILLAATWIELLSPDEIAEQLTQGLDFLESDLRDLPERQRSLRAVFNHSWQLLEEQEQAVFRRLTIFRGGFALEAAQRITDASLRMLMALVEKSLLVRSGRGRFEMHELLRQFGAEQLAHSRTEENEVRAQHAAYYLEWLQRLTPDLHSPRQTDVMEAMEVERENLRLAWEWMVTTGRSGLLSGAIRSLSRFFEWYGRYHEGATIFQSAAEPMKGDDSLAGLRLRLHLLIRQGKFRRLLADRDEFEGLVAEAERLVAKLQQAGEDVRSEQAAILGERAELVRYSNKQEAAALAREALALYEAVDDDIGMAAMLYVAGASIYETGDKKAAAALLEECLNINRRLGSPRETAYALSRFGYSAYSTGREELGESLIREAYALFEKIGDRAGLALGVRDLGGICHVQGDMAGAVAYHDRSSKIYEELGDMHNSLEAASLALLYSVFNGNYDETRRRGQEVFSAARAFGHAEAIAFVAHTKGLLALAENRPAEAYTQFIEAERLFAASGGFRQQGVLNAFFALAARKFGRVEEPMDQIIQALDLAIQSGAVHGTLHILVVVAWLKAQIGELERAAEVDALVGKYPMIAQNRWWWDVARREVAEKVQSLPAEVLAQAQERGSHRAHEVIPVAIVLLAEFKAQTST